MSADQAAGQVETLLSKAQTMLNLPAALIQTTSARLIQAVAHSSRVNPSMLVAIRIYIQKQEDLANHLGDNGWGHFLVERSVNHPGDSKEASDSSIEIYLYTEGEVR